MKLVRGCVMQPICMNRDRANNLCLMFSRQPTRKPTDRRRELRVQCRHGLVQLYRKKRFASVVVFLYHSPNQTLGQGDLVHCIRVFGDLYDLSGLVP